MRSILKVGGVAHLHAKNMIKYFVPLGRDVSAADHKDVIRELEVSDVCCYRTVEESV